MTEMTGEQVLLIEMDENDSGALTIGGYLVNLLIELWREGECFSGKRAFGNSDWQDDVSIALAKAGAIPATLDDEDPDWPEWEYDYKDVDRVMVEAIQALLPR